MIFQFDPFFNTLISSSAILISDHYLLGPIPVQSVGTGANPAFIMRIGEIGDAALTQPTDSPIFVHGNAGKRFPIVPEGLLLSSRVAACILCFRN